MAKASFTTPILLLVFNRADYLAAQLSILAELKPVKLYVAADGPRLGNKQDTLASHEIKSLLAQVSWPCQVKTLFRQENLGCKRAVSSAIDWFFSQEEEGIILEDDCIPTRSFFSFCSELLKKYRHNEAVMHISGTTFLPPSQMKTSYDFCSQPICWGWASWRRAWQNYDVTMNGWQQDRNTNFLAERFSSSKTQQYWSFFFNAILDHSINTWDYQWIYTIWKEDGLAILPRYNLVKNIGFDSRATHTKNAWFSLPLLATTELTFPLTHPSKISLNHDLDHQIQKVFQGPWWRQGISLLGRIVTKLKLAQ